MKKIFRKSNIFSFILGSIIFGGIGVVSAHTIFATDIGYTSKSSTWKVDNVKDAIDDLYEKSQYVNGSNIEKIELGTLNYTFGSGSYSSYSDTKTIDVKEIIPLGYSTLSENNFSYEIYYVENGYVLNNRYLKSTLNNPTLSYNVNTGILSLTINVNNGESDYIEVVKVKLYAFK